VIEDRFCHYKTGYAVIDDEHLMLGQKLDEIIIACRIRPPNFDQIRQLIVDASVLINQHYDNEERLMRESKYKFYESHCAAHDELRKRLREMIKAEYNQCFVDELKNDLEHIYFEHIDAYDMQIELLIE
jgi:hemerythrin-like metal-binding protein